MVLRHHHILHLLLLLEILYNLIIMEMQPMNINKRIKRNDIIKLSLHISLSPSPSSVCICVFIDVLFFSHSIKYFRKSRRTFSVTIDHHQGYLTSYDITNSFSVLFYSMINRKKMRIHDGTSSLCVYIDRSIGTRRIDRRRYSACYQLHHRYPIFLERNGDFRK